MAITDYSSLKQTVANYLHRDDLSSDGSGSTTTPIEDAISLFEAEANRKLRVRQQMVTQASSASTDGSFSLPTDYLAWESVTWSYSGIYKELEYVDPSYIAERYPDYPASTPEVFTIMGTTDSVGKVQLMPTSTSAVNFTYYQKITALSTDNTSNWLLSAHPDLYMAGAMTEACVYTKDYDTAAIWKGRRDTLFDEITNLDTKTRGPSYIRVPGYNP